MGNLLNFNRQPKDFRSIGYARALGSVGHLLQMRDLQAFELSCENREIHLRCGYQKPPCSLPVEMRYSLDEIQRLESEYQKDSIASSTMVDFYSLAEVLRGMGAYLNKKDGSLVKISNNESCMAAGSVKLQYQTSDGDLKEEVLSLSSIYELCVRFYKERTKSSRSANIFADSRP